MNQQYFPLRCTDTSFPGYKAAGFSIAKAVENDPIAIETFTANNRETPVFPGSVVDFNARYDPQPSARLYKRGKSLSNNRHKATPNSMKELGHTPGLHASPPCNGFSGANRTGGKNDSENNELSFCFVDGVRIVQPDVATFENVLGMWRRKYQPYIRKILTELMKLGYQVRCCKLMACDYGDPQKRPRLFFFASKQHVPLPMVPPKTHGDPDCGLLPYVTVADAFRGVTETMPNSGYEASSVALPRLEADEMAPTVLGQSVKPYHPSEDRCITVREAACLQSFPHNYTISGSVREQYKQVGNAVPVMLASAVAQSVRRVLAYKYKEGEEV